MTEGPGYTVVGWSLLISGLTCLMSFLCSVLLAWMDRRRNRLLSIQEIGESGEVVKISDVKDFPMSFWFLTLACLAYYGAIFPFVSLAQDFFKSRFDFTSQEANSIIGLIYLISAPVSPLLGLLLDKVGKNITWCFLAILASGGCHCLLAFTQVRAEYFAKKLDDNDKKKGVLIFLKICSKCQIFLSFLEN